MPAQTLFTILFSLSAVLGLWSLILTYLLISQKKFFQRFTQGISKRDLKSILQNIAKSLKIISDEINHLKTDIKEIKRLDRQHFQKVGFVRYNPFSDTGGDQSFCLCLLDDHDNGFVITSLHSREQTRIYAKSISKGVSQHSELSKEEQEALKQAIKSKLISTKTSRRR